MIIEAVLPATFSSIKETKVSVRHPVGPTNRPVLERADRGPAAVDIGS